MKHLHSLDDKSLAKQVLEEQISHNWNGLSRQAKTIADELEFEGLFDELTTKQQFKNKVKFACQEYNDAYLKNEIMQYKKMKALKDKIQKGNE